MKILFVCQYYFPENFQITPICEQLVSDGYDVTVLTGLPNYPTGVVPREYKKGKRNEVINGVKIIRCHEIGRKKGILYLGLNYLSFLLSSNRKIKKIKEQFDLVFVYQLSPVFMGIPGKKYANKHNVPMILYCCDLWPESLKMYIKNENNILFKIIKKISKKIYNSADKLICQSSSFINYMENVHSIAKNKLTYIPAFADENYLCMDFNVEDDVTDFVFLGNLGNAQNLFSVLEAIKLNREIVGFNFHFVGDGSCLDKMKKFVVKEGLENIVKFYGRRPVEEMPLFYKLADVCVVSLKADNATGYTLPSKVQGYMAAGKPILGMIEGSARDVIEESKCGICVDSDDINEFANAMKKFISNKSLYFEYGQNGRNYFIQNFRKNIIMEKIKNEIDRMEKSNECV